MAASGAVLHTFWLAVRSPLQVPSLIQESNGGEHPANLGENSRQPSSPVNSDLLEPSNHRDILTDSATGLSER